jgi:DNA polymerase-3 subunit epsilon
MREIVLDTETTGFDPAEGHRIVEVGCLELFNHMPTGKTLHFYINPERDIPAEATAVHGITNAQVADKPVFAEIAAELYDFLQDATLVIHNAEFDVKFLNAEMRKFGYKNIKVADCIDTVLMARKKFPGQPANLDALCRRFNIDLSARELHGALLDAQLLSKVYLELLGGRQHGLGLDSNAQATLDSEQPAVLKQQNRPRRSFPLSQADDEAHAKMLAGIKNNIWSKAD